MARLACDSTGDETTEQRVSSMMVSRYLYIYTVFYQTVALNQDPAGAGILLLCTNAMHKVASAVAATTDATFIHIADPTAAEIRKHGIRTVGLLGTRYTMEEDFYRERIEHSGVRVLVPERQERDDVHGVH